jgi:hypothetical protein
MTISRSTSGIFLSAHQALALKKPLKNALPYSVQRSRRIMRGVIIRSISPEDAQNMRCLLAIEGYVELGMFEEAEEELRQLDPAWFALKQTRFLQLRILTGQSQDE